MPQSQGPDWAYLYPPGMVPASSMHVMPPSGNDVYQGHMFGTLLAHNERQTRALERMADKIDDLPGEIARALPGGQPSSMQQAQAPPSTPPSDRLSWKDRVQLLLAVAFVLAALFGKVSWQEAMQFAGR